MKRKGFTLIELLAVIVILAIIVLIATPIVLNIIENSKDSSNKRSIELYGSAVEQAVAKAKLNGNTLPSGKYTTTDGKTYTFANGDATFQVDYDGSKTACDIVISNKGNIYLENCKVKDEATEYTYGEKVYYNGEVVYFNVTIGSKCTSSEAVSTTGTKAGCMKFYAFNDDGGSTVNLLLDHNTTEDKIWTGDYYNTSGPKELIEQLKEDTDGWQGTEPPSNYTMDQRGQESNAYYTIDYSGYKARLITANEIATITGNTTWDETIATSDYYFHDNTQTQYKGAAGTNKYAWLFDNTIDCTTYGCNVADSLGNFGYWTASSVANDARCAWFVESVGSVSSLGTYNNIDIGGVGVRPVIEVLKSKLN